MKRERWNEKWRERHDHGYDEPSRVLVAEAADLPAGRALDLACGMGRNAIWLAERGWNVTAVDYSEVALAEASRRAAARGVEVEWILADVTAWEPQAGAHDLVCVLYLQVPTAERRVVLARAQTALAPGGTILVIGHDLLNLTEGWGGPSSADVLFTADAVAAELSELAVEKAERVIRVVEDEHGYHEAIDALVRAHRPDLCKRLDVKFTHSWMGACARRITASSAGTESSFQHCHRPRKLCSLVHALPRSIPIPQQGSSA